MAPTGLGSSSLVTVGAGGGEPQQVSPSLTCQGTTFGGTLPVRVGPEGQKARLLDIIVHILQFPHWIG